LTSRGTISFKKTQLQLLLLLSQQIPGWDLNLIPLHSQCLLDAMQVCQRMGPNIIAGIYVNGVELFASVAKDLNPT
jgi:hypothetical protein